MRAATPSGRLPTLDRSATTGSCAGRSATSVPSNSLLTQTPSGSTATAVGPSPTGIDRRDGVRRRVDSRDACRRGCSRPRRHRSPTAIPVGPFPTLDRLRRPCRVAGSMRATRSAACSLAQSEPAPTASSRRRDRQRLRRPAGAGSILRHRAVARVRDPDRAGRVDDRRPGRCRPRSSGRPVFVFGSILETVPSRLFATQTKPPPMAIPLGPLPTGIVCDHACSSPGRSGRPVPSSTFATQIRALAGGDRASASRRRPTSATSRPDSESTMPTESPETAAAVAVLAPPWPSAKIGIATAAAITPASARQQRSRGAADRLRLGDLLRLRAAGTRSAGPRCRAGRGAPGRSMSFSRYEPRSRSATPPDLVLDQLAGRVREQHLAAVRRPRRSARPGGRRARRSARRRRPARRCAGPSAPAPRRPPATRARRAPAARRRRPRAPRSRGAKAKKNASPCVSISLPAAGLRRPPGGCGWCSASTSPYRSPSCLSRRVEPSMSVLFESLTGFRGAPARARWTRRGP